VLHEQGDHADDSEQNQERGYTGSAPLLRPGSLPIEPMVERAD
jgi:hypothetical protein